MEKMVATNGTRLFQYVIHLHLISKTSTTVRDMGNLTFFADVHEGIPRLALRPNADGQAADHGISMGSCV